MNDKTLLQEIEHSFRSRAEYWRDKADEPHAPVIALALEEAGEAISDVLSRTAKTSKSTHECPPGF